MNLQDIIVIGIIIHACFGGLALLAGSISIISKKGGVTHKKAGKIFYYGMLLSGCAALIISVLPKHVNPFLFVIGLFSVYLILMGYCSLRYRRIKEQAELYWDKIIRDPCLLWV